MALKALVAPFGIIQFSSDWWGVPPQIAFVEHPVGTQHSPDERKHLTQQTRIMRWAR